MEGGYEVLNAPGWKRVEGRIEGDVDIVSVISFVLAHFDTALLLVVEGSGVVTLAGSDLQKWIYYSVNCPLAVLTDSADRLVWWST